MPAGRPRRQRERSSHLARLPAFVHEGVFVQERSFVTRDFLPAKARPTQAPLQSLPVSAAAGFASHHEISVCLPYFVGRIVITRIGIGQIVRATTRIPKLVDQIIRANRFVGLCVGLSFSTENRHPDDNNCKNSRQDESAGVVEKDKSAEHAPSILQPSGMYL